MTSVVALQQLLENQYGGFIRSDDYDIAFKEAMSILSTLSIPKSLNNHSDVFYLFLHHLIAKLFQKIQQLEQQLEKQQSSV